MEIVQRTAAPLRWLRSRIDLRKESGATAVEYSIMLVFIAAVIIAIVGVLGNQLVPGFCAVVTGIGGSPC
jgi:Flp pilus assembly pilin Flp